MLKRFKINFFSFQSIVPDMLLMGIVKAVYPTHLLMSLPGRLVGRVPITNISKAYTSLLQNALENPDDDDDEDQSIVRPKNLKN